jgi:FtsP/CotA-like multicopper oxidase with cupredoxin domain
VKPEPISRRRALQLGALGAASAVVGAAGLTRTGPPWSPNGTEAPASVPPVGQFLEPTTLSSEGGRLDVLLSMSEGEAEIAGARARVLTYNGGVPGPTLRLRPGDEVTVRLLNGLDAPTNLHTSGLHVSPRGTGDNTLLSVGAGQIADYRFSLPEDHPTGVFWYHPLRNGFAAEQVFGGLYGAIVVTDGVPVRRERILVISDISLNTDGTIRRIPAGNVLMGREGDLLLVNGQLQPVLTARPGEQERWRVVNACTARYLRLALPGQALGLLGIDGGHEPRPRVVDEVVLAPGNRADVLIGMRAGTTALRSLGYERGTVSIGGLAGRRSLSGPAVLATLAVAGPAAATTATALDRATDADLRFRAVERRRSIAFTMGTEGGMGTSFGFDGRAFDVTRVDQRVRAGALEEWTVWNRTPLDQPFSLHVWPMQVIEKDGEDVDTPMWRDVVNVTAGGRVRVLIHFSRFTGRAVYHCQILDHADAGMMGIVEVA